MSLLFYLFHEWFESCFIDSHGIILWCKCHQWGWCDGHEIFLEWWQFPMLFMTSFKKLIITLNHLGNVWFNVVGSSIVSNKSLTSQCNPNWNWLMSATSFHELSHVKCLNSYEYTIVKWGPWWNDCNLFIVVHSLFESPKMALNCSTNVSKLFNDGDWHSNKGANHIEVVPNSKVLKSTNLN